MSKGNEYRFRSKPASAVGLIASNKGRLSLYLPLLFKRFRSRRRRRFFQRHRGANGRIGKVVGDSFHFCLSQGGSSLSHSVANAGCTVVSLALSFLLECVCLPSLCSPSVAFVGCTTVFLGSELALLEYGCLPSRCSPRLPLMVALWFLLLRLV